MYLHLMIHELITIETLQQCKSLATGLNNSDWEACVYLQGICSGKVCECVLQALFYPYSRN